MDAPGASPTIMDVARRAGVSRATASRAINSGSGVSPETRRRVGEVIAELGYRPNPAAQALASGRSAVVDLVVVHGDPASFGTNPYYGRVVAGIVTELASTYAQMRVHIVAEQHTAEVLDQVAHTASLGAILVNVSAELAGQLYRQCDRVVSLGRSAPGVPVIESENAAGAYAAVSHLHHEGRRRIAAIHGPRTHPDATARRDGYLGAMRDVGLAAVSSAGEFRREAGYRHARELLLTHPDLDALFAACDLTATGAMQALAEAGRRVPDDVAVVGFDDSVIAACSSPPMTSVRQPVEEMAAAATRALLHGAVAPYWRQVFPVELVLRQTA